MPDFLTMTGVFKPKPKPAAKKNDRPKWLSALATPVDWGKAISDAYAPLRRQLGMDEVKAPDPGYWIKDLGMSLSALDRTRDTVNVRRGIPKGTPIERFSQYPTNLTNPNPAPAPIPEPTVTPVAWKEIIPTVVTPATLPVQVPTPKTVTPPVTVQPKTTPKTPPASLQPVVSNTVPLIDLTATSYFAEDWHKIPLRATSSPFVNRRR